MHVNVNEMCETLICEMHRCMQAEHNVRIRMGAVMLERCMRNHNRETKTIRSNNSEIHLPGGVFLCAGVSNAVAGR